VTSWLLSVTLEMASGFLRLWWVTVVLLYDYRRLAAYASIGSLIKAISGFLYVSS
jgi:hypothetical protein